MRQDVVSLEDPISKNIPTNNYYSGRSVLGFIGVVSVSLKSFEFLRWSNDHLADFNLLT